MNRNPLLAILVAGALFGWFAPDMSGQPSVFMAESPAPVPPAPTGHLQLAQDTGPQDGEVVLPRAPDGHFYADVTIDGSSAHMLVDTGASMIALTGADADSLGIYWDTSAVRPVARGASGTVYGVPVTLETVGLGDFEAQKVEAVIVPEGLDISLLGQSFLSKIAKVEIDQQRMVLGGS